MIILKKELHDFKKHPVQLVIALSANIISLCKVFENAYILMNLHILFQYKKCKIALKL